ncbi:distal tail protein Dit [Streptococcus parauberis]|uniref:distal tail protein Dit n=1 Tax=Streptococcus parauberis TaxID=1348 RepID=UPI00020CBC07|nr:distal tail protein Dit [Streptococcus parauberis]AEF25733.1 phage tail protein [Streptococcus parauberis KCTC 11537]QBX27342.1 capsid and scaffold protein [Streptococcus phage Javan384]UWM90505.1 phage tail family protein [Streptococcus parauberis]UWM91292.1 phage tail family protein [Streptococcus parauberis]
MVQMTFNNVDLSNMINIMSVNRDIGNPVELTTNNSLFIGTIVQKNKVSSKTITVDFYIKDRTSDYSLNQLKHKLAGIFNVDTDVKIKFSDEPDKYYLGRPINRISSSDPISWLGLVSIELFIPDGVAHSISYKKVTSYTESDGKLVFELNNNGNVEALPVITAKMNSENGYFGLVNQTGVMEIGDREIIDSETRGFSERPFDYTDSGTGIKDGFAKGTKNVAILNDNTATLDGTLSVGPLWGRDHLQLNNTFTSGQHASSLTFDLPSDGSLFDYIWWRQIFYTGSPNTYGFIKVMVSDSDGKFLYGVETIKRSNSMEAEYNFLTADGQGGYKFTDIRKKFKPNNDDDDNPFNPSRGFSDIKRIDDKVYIYWFGSLIERTFSELKGKKSAKLHIAIGNIQSKPMITYMYVDGIKYRKDNVAFGYNIPNPYGTGSNITINGENKTFLVDNIAKLNHVVDYSNWLKIPVGTSTLEINTSSWNELKPTFNIAFEERWL